jgi:hypothetical protein
MAVFEIAGYCSCGPAVLVKTVVLALSVADSEADPARGVATVIATAIVFGPRVLSRLAAKVADWY